MILAQVIRQITVRYKPLRLFDGLGLEYKCILFTIHFVITLAFTYNNIIGECLYNIIIINNHLTFGLSARYPLFEVKNMQITSRPAGL